MPTQCSWLAGTISLAKDEGGRKVENAHFKYILSDGPIVKKTNGTQNGKDHKNKLEELNEGLRDMKINMIVKLGKHFHIIFYMHIDIFKSSHYVYLDIEKAEEMYADIVTDYPNCLQVHMTLASKLDSSHDMKLQIPFSFKSTLNAQDDHTQTMAKLKRIIDLCDLVITGIDENALLAFYGLKSDNRVDASKIKS